MCLFTKSKLPEKISQEITYYKLLITLEDGKLESPYRHFIFELGKEYEAEGELNLKPTCVDDIYHIEGGVFHSYTDINEAKHDKIQMIRDDKKYKNLNIYEVRLCDYGYYGQWNDVACKYITIVKLVE